VVTPALLAPETSGADARSVSRCSETFHAVSSREIAQTSHVLVGQVMTAMPDIATPATGG